MTHFAPVAPLAIHRKLAETFDLGQYHLLLAQDILADQSNYSDFWLDVGQHAFVIVDNGVIELGEPLPIEEVIKAGYAIAADCIVLPDTIGDRNETLRQAYQAFEDMNRQDLEYPTLGVAQGKEYLMVLDCARELIKLGVDYVSIPRGVANEIGSRKHLVKALHGEYPDLKIHLLGFSDNIEDDIASAQLEGVLGIDSAFPLWYKGELTREPPTHAYFGQRPHDYHQWTEVSVSGLANLRQVREWLKS